MSKPREETEKKTAHKLFALWTGRESEWLTYKEIISRLKEDGISERTVARYLSILVHNKKLMKEERGYKKTFYRPYDEFMHTLSLSRDLFRIHEESLSRIGKEIVRKFEKTLVDSKEIGDRILELISEEIDKIPEEKRSDEEVAEAIINVLSRERLTELDSKILVSLVDRFLFDAFYYPLSDPYGCVGTTEPFVDIDILERNVSLLLSSYMNLWSFMYKHPGASFEFQKYIKEKFSGIISIKKNQ
jgi:hypothetical protein